MVPTEPLEKMEVPELLVRPVCPDPPVTQVSTV